MTPPDAPVEFATHELNGVLYLFAANKSGHAQKVSFSSDALAGKKVAVLNEKHTATLQGDTLDDSFTPYGVHVYRIE